MSWGRWAGLVEQFRQALPPIDGSPIGLGMGSTAESFALLAALGLAGADACLIDGALGDEAALLLKADRGLASIVRAGPAPGASGPAEILVLGPSGFVNFEPPKVDGRSSPFGGTVTLFTSGSTGVPTPVCHTWRSLMRPARPGVEGADPRPRRWLWAFRPHLYAGLQVFAQCLVDRGTIVVPPAGASARDVAGLMREAAITHVSSTPSYWRWLLAMAGPHGFEGVEPTQITLGGEIVEQDLLDRIGRVFPGARLVHIYATSELGRCFSVTDGRAGFPDRYLERPSADGVELRVEDGELFVRSANAADGSAPAWVATGDLVGPVEGRFLFQGRRSDLINVGGKKVCPIAVERVVQSVPGVLDSRVYARRSSMAGHLVACEIVVDPDLPPDEVRRSVQRRCQEVLAPHQRPRFIDLVAAICLSAATKKLRGPEPSTSIVPCPALGEVV